MKRNVKIILGVLIIIIGLGILLSTYYLTMKHEVFDEMNRKYYEQSISMEQDVLELNEEDITITTTTAVVTTEVVSNPTTTKVVDTYLGVLIIPKINLERGFYPINSKNNNVKKGIYVHPLSTMPGSKANNLILASHSGSSSISFFKNLYKLGLKDDVYLKYNNKKYHYKIKDIYDVPKNGTVGLRINDQVSTISLITCTKNDKTKQTVYIAELV